MAEIRVNTTGTLKLFDADDSHSAGIAAGTVTASETLMTLNTADITFSIPKIVIGDATAEDTSIVFDGNAQDFYIGLDDSADDLIIGLGSAVGTTPIISVDENKDVSIPDGGLTITTSDNTDQLTLITTDTDASAGARLRLYRNSSSPAVADFTGDIRFEAKNDAGEDFVGASIVTRTDAVADGSEGCQFILQSMVAGTTRSRIAMYPASTVINDDTQDIDFRVESDGNAYGLFVDAGNNMVTIGKNTDSIGTVGHFFGTVGSVNHARDDNNVMAISRHTGDGDIMSFYKDSSIVGYIGTGNSGDLYIGNDDTGLLFAGGSDAIMPTNKTSLRDNAIDLGHPSYRFDDVYATNNVIQTSDRNEKQDEANLTAAETKVAVAAKGLLKKYRWKNAFAKKGDDARIHFGIIAQDLQDAFTAEGLDASKYAMFCSNTWWEKEISVPAKVADKEKGIDAEDAYTYKDLKDEETEGYTKRTRLGVRYDQVLAFIIAAI